MFPWSRPVLAIVLGLLAFCAGCADSDVDGAAGLDTITVIATTSILGDVVGQVVGDRAGVEVLIPNGTDPHAFEPSARQVARLRDADLVVANGLGLETSLEPILQAAEDDDVEVLELVEHVDPLPYANHDAELGDEDEHGELDPHFWTDPLRVRRAVDVIVDTLSGIQASGGWRARAEQYQGRLAALHAEIEEILTVVPPDRRKLVTNHEVLGYFAARYDFEVIGVVIPGGTTIAEPSAADLASLVATIRTEDVPAVFGETGQPRALVDALRREAGLEVDVVELFTEALGESDEADSYIGMMHVNAQRIAEALA